MLIALSQYFAKLICCSNKQLDSSDALFACDSLGRYQDGSGLNVS